MAGFATKALIILSILLVASGCTKTEYRSVDPSAYDCGDFSSHREAQDFFESHSPDSDPYHLDQDGDGNACETLQ